MNIVPNMEISFVKFQKHLARFLVLFYKFIQRFFNHFKLTKKTDQFPIKPNPMEPNIISLFIPFDQSIQQHKLTFNQKAQF